MEMLIIFLIPLIIISIFLYKMYINQKRFKEEITKQAAIINQLILRDLISSEAKGSDDLLKQNLSSIAKKIFKILKIRAKFKATSYPELVEELKNSNLEPGIKKDLIEFFSSISLIEYSNEPLSEEKKEELKRNALTILKKMEQFQELQV